MKKAEDYIGGSLRTMKKGEKTMVRVCCDDNCQQEQGIYGCVYGLEIYIYCEDCRLYKPDVYQNCLLRVTPVKEQEVTHGLCRKCAKKLIKRY